MPEPRLELAAAAVDVVLASVDDAPTPLGGTLVDGLYDITSYVFYGDYPVEIFMDGFREVVRIRDGATALDILRTDFSSLVEVRASIAQVEPPTTSMDLTIQCPTELLGRTPTQPYTATASELAFFEERDGVLSVITLARRQ